MTDLLHYGAGFVGLAAMISTPVLLAKSRKARAIEKKREIMRSGIEAAATSVEQIGPRVIATRKSAEGYTFTVTYEKGAELAYSLMEGERALTEEDLSHEDGHRLQLIGANMYASIRGWMDHGAEDNDDKLNPKEEV